MKEEMNTFNTHDRDLLIRLDSKMESFINEVRSTNLAAAKTSSDHEARIRVLEASYERTDGAVRSFKWMAGAIAFLVSTIVSLVAIIGGVRFVK